jgi:hypothetical protein
MVYLESGLLHDPGRGDTCIKNDIPDRRCAPAGFPDHRFAPDGIPSCCCTPNALLRIGIIA